MFVIRNDKRNNAVSIITTKTDLELKLVNQLNGKEVTQSLQGLKDGDYTVFFIDGIDLVGGEYIAYFGDDYATMCMVISVNSNIKKKYQ